MNQTLVKLKPTVLFITVSYFQIIFYGKSVFLI